MDLHAAWKKLGEEKLNKPVTGTVGAAETSKHPVAKIILNFKMGMAFIVMFLFVFAYLLYIIPQPIVKAGLVLVMIVYVVFLLLNLRVLRKMTALYNLDQDILKMLEGVYSLVTDSMNFQLKLSWGFFPICVGAGFLLGLSIEKDAAALILKPMILVILLITMMVMTPICYYMTKRMNKIAYGKYLDQIQDLIRQLKEGGESR